MEYMTEQIIKNRTTTINNIHIYGKLDQLQLEQLARKCDLAFLKEVQEPVLLANQESDPEPPPVEEEINVTEEQDDKGNYVEPKNYINVELDESEFEFVKTLKGDSHQENDSPVMSASLPKKLSEFREVGGIPEPPPIEDENDVKEESVQKKYIEVELDESEFEFIKTLKSNPQEEHHPVKSVEVFTAELWEEWGIPEQYRLLPSLSIIMHEQSARDGCLGKIYAAKENQVLFGDDHTKIWFQIESPLPLNTICFGEVDLESKNMRKCHILEPFNNELVELKTA